LNVKENPNHPICIRNAKKETKKCKPSYLHKKVTKNNSKSSNLHTKCKKKLKKNPKKIQIILFAYEMQKKKLKKIQYIYLICIRNAKKKLNLICIKK